MCPRLAVHPHQAEMMAQSGGNYLSLFSTIKPYKMNRCKRFEGHMVLLMTFLGAFVVTNSNIIVSLREYILLIVAVTFSNNYR